MTTKCSLRLPIFLYSIGKYAFFHAELPLELVYAGFFMKDSRNKNAKKDTNTKINTNTKNSVERNVLDSQNKEEQNLSDSSNKGNTLGKSDKRNKNARMNRVKALYGKSISSLARFSYSNPVLVIIIALSLWGSGIYLSMFIERDMSPEDAMAEDSSVVQTVTIINEEFPRVGMETAYVVIEADICNPDLLAAVNESIANMYDDDHIAMSDQGPKVLSILPYVRMITRVRDNGSGAVDANGDGIPDTRENLTLALNQLYENGIDGVITPGKIRSLLSRGSSQEPFDGLLLVLETNHTQGNRGGKLLDELHEDMKPVKNMDGTEIGYAGFSFERYEMITEMTGGMIISTIVSIILGTFFVMLLFKSVRFGFITALPIIFVTGWVMLSMYFLGFKLNMVTVTITTMTIGIGIDYAIHIVERYRHERSKGLAMAQSMDRSIETTGLSLFAAGATTFSGFFVISFSKIGTFHTFGVLASIMVVFALISTFMVLPAIIAISEKIGKKN